MRPAMGITTRELFPPKQNWADQREAGIREPAHGPLSTKLLPAPSTPAIESIGEVREEQAQA
jgi:hypothetical protein